MFEIEEKEVLGNVVRMSRPGQRPVLLLHGLGGSARSFEAVEPHLHLAGFSTIALNMPGYGESAAFASEFPTPQQLADNVDAVLHALALDAVHVVGHSLGGVLAAALVHHHPQRVKALVLSSSPRGFDVADPQAWKPSFTQRVRDLEADGPAAYAEKRAAGLCAVDAPVAAVGNVKEQMARLTPSGLRTASSLYARANLVSLLSGRSIPVSYVAADRDRIVPLAEGQAIAADLDVALSVIAGVGHAGYTEDPLAYAHFCTAPFRHLN